MNLFHNWYSLAFIMLFSCGLLWAHYEPSYRFDLPNWAFWLCVAGLLYPLSLFARVVDESQSANRKVDKESRQRMRDAGMTEDEIKTAFQRQRQVL